MKKVLLHCAMEKEGKQIADQLELKKKDEKTYQKDNITLIVTGIGKQLTAIEITKYIEENSKPDIIINMGYVGSTNEKIGSWVNVNKSYNYEWNIPGEQRYIIENNNEKLGNQKLELMNNDKIKKIPCYTAESFVTSTDITGEALFDMELHSLAIICDIYKIKLLSLKKVSDNLSLSGYYDNLDKEEIFELTSGLEFIKDMLI